MTFNGTNGGTIDVPNAATNLTLAGVLTAGKLTKTGLGTLTIGGSADNASLTMLVNAGTVYFAKASTTSVHSIGSASTGLTIASGASVILSGTGNDQIYSQAGVVINSGGTLDLGGTNEGFSNLSGTGTVTNSLVGTSTLTLGENNGSGTFNGVLSDGTATAILAGRSWDRHDALGARIEQHLHGVRRPLATTAVLGSIFYPAYSSSGNAVSSLVQIGNTGTGFAVLQLGAPEQIPDNAVVTFSTTTNNWAYLKMMGNSETVGSITDTDAAGVLEDMESETINTSAVLTLTSTLASTFNGFLRSRSGGSGTGTLGISLPNATTLTLSGNNIIYNGPTTVSQSATYRLLDGTAYASSITNSGNVLFTATTGITSNGSITNAATGVVNVNAGGATNLNGAINNSGTVNLTATAQITMGTERPQRRRHPEQDRARSSG